VSDVVVKDMWVVLAGNIPVCIVRDGQEHSMMLTTTDVIPNRGPKSSSVYLPVFASKHKARLFADKVRRTGAIFMTDIRIVRVELQKD